MEDRARVRSGLSSLSLYVFHMLTHRCQNGKARSSMMQLAASVPKGSQPSPRCVAHKEIGAEQGVWLSGKAFILHA